MKPAMILAGLLLFAAGAVATAADPLFGTWKLNKAKSTPSPGSELPQSCVCTYSDAGNGKIKFEAEVVTAKGETRHPTWVGKRDGKEIPFTGAPQYDSIINYPAKQGTAGSWVTKKAGKEVHKGSWSLSPDGKTLTWDIRRTDANGKPVQFKYVLDRQ